MCRWSIYLSTLQASQCVHLGSVSLSLSSASLSDFSFFLSLSLILNFYFRSVSFLYIIVTSTILTTTFHIYWRKPAPSITFECVYVGFQLISKQTWRLKKKSVWTKWRAMNYWCEWTQVLRAWKTFQKGRFVLNKLVDNRVLLLLPCAICFGFLRWPWRRVLFCTFCTQVWKCQKNAPKTFPPPEK